MADSQESPVVHVWKGLPSKRVAAGTSGRAKCPSQSSNAFCFSARSFKRTHPTKAHSSHIDADATLASSMILGVADGVSQLDQYGIDPRKLPEELLLACKRLARRQLTPDGVTLPAEAYNGPVELLQKAFRETQSLGSLTTVLAWMDNGMRVKGKPHPMATIITVGDCRALVLRRTYDLYQVVSKTEMQRVDGNANTPLQLARVDSRIDPNFEEHITLDIIQQGSAVQCVSAYLGDVLILGSDGVFDNLFEDEIAHILNSELRASSTAPIPGQMLERLACRIVQASHGKTQPGHDGLMQEAPIGRAGKCDDTSVVVAEVVEWTDKEKTDWWLPHYQQQLPSTWQNVLKFALLGTVGCCDSSVGTVCQDDPDFGPSEFLEKEMTVPDLVDPKLGAPTGNFLSDVSHYRSLLRQ